MDLQVETLYTKQTHTHGLPPHFCVKKNLRLVTQAKPLRLLFKKMIEILSFQGDAEGLSTSPFTYPKLFAHGIGLSVKAH